LIDAERVDSIAGPTLDQERSVRLYADPDGNGLLRRRRYAL
jgi:hypothetical protein